MKKIFLKSWIYALFTLFLLFFGNIFVNADDNWFQVPTQNWGQKQTWWQNQATNKENDISWEACTRNSSCLADKSFVLPVKDLIPWWTCNNYKKTNDSILNFSSFCNDYLMRIYGYVKLTRWDS